MSFYIQDSGHKFIAELLAGSGLKINGIYVEYGSEAIAAGKRSIEYYKKLMDSTEAGCARVAITDSYVDDSNVIHFNALVCHGDLKGVPLTSGMSLSCVSIAYMPDMNMTNDIIICTTDLKYPVKLVDNAYTSVHTSMRLGA